MRIEMPFGYIETSGLNDIKIVSTTGDPVNAIFASPEGISLGAVSWGILRPDGNVEQKVLFQGKVDERTRYLPDIKERGGEFTIHCHDGIKHYRNGELRDDDSMILCLMARHDMVWINRLVTKFEYPDGLPGWSGPIPSNLLPIPPIISTPHVDTYKGFKNGDFTSLEGFFGFESEDKKNYELGRMTWAEIVDVMFRRQVPTDKG